MASRGNANEPRMWVGVVQPPQSRWPGVVGGLLIGILTAVATSLLLLALTPLFKSALAEADCDDPRGLHLVSGVGAESSSALTESDPIVVEHPAALAIDGDLGTSWVEGADGLGKNETLTLTLPGTPDVQLVCVINGYAKSEALFLRNARVRQFTVKTDQGIQPSMLRQKPVADYAAYQSLAIPKGSTTEIVLTIAIAVGGVGGDRAADTSISEVEVWARD
ncbi:hypothetical protein E3O47_13495 [Cryobacterium sp. TMT2-17-1]|uniref:NADase-type glycan-binding domain-containing protein n=1 Tax=unclassified Cryobacterium TaxID=2649013 RepID=UPI00106A08FD|nr:MULTISPECIES: hypothetical protein [unclassified Cryobacterium]TFC36112.1 hypothetical protein E3O28_09290 [Cryobacterium sp. TMT2-14]TFC48325.1 hypothetical protein E3O47_13495 [Cryobacterium sp. TMT2-17-1]